MEIHRHDRYMLRAVELAEQGRGSVSPNPVVGAVLVRDGKVIASDWHRKYGEGHAEWNLLNAFQDDIYADDVLYVTMEPCCHFGKTPPCTDIILEKNVKHIVIGLMDPNPDVSGKGVALLREGGVEVIVLDDVRYSKITSRLKLIDILSWQNRFFFRWIRDRRPWVALKIAQTLDGLVVPERGTKYRLTGDESIAHSHEMRAMYDAILVGLGTVIVDNPRLTVRDVRGVESERQPLRVILDAALGTPLDSALLKSGTMIFRGTRFKRIDSRKHKLLSRGVEVVDVDSTEESYLNLGQVLDELAFRGVTSLLVEGGPSVWSSFLRYGLVDELMLYLAPQFLGNGVASFENLAGGFDYPLQFREIKVLGNDVYWNGFFVNKHS